MNTKPRTIVNCTPHDVHVYRDYDGPLVRTYPRAEWPVRMNVDTVQHDVVADDILVFKTWFDEVEMLPPPENGVYYIVSSLVRMAIPERTDLISPHNLVRDGAGNVIGCTAFQM